MSDDWKKRTLIEYICIGGIVLGGVLWCVAWTFVIIHVLRVNR